MSAEQTPVTVTLPAGTWRALLAVVPYQSMSYTTQGDRIATAVGAIDNALPPTEKRHNMSTVRRTPLAEIELPGARLGRHIHHDQRSHAFAAAQADQIVSVRHQAVGLPLTQTRGSCTAEALCGALNSAPDFTGRTFTQPDADALYDREIVLEGANPATDDPGGSGLEVCKAALAGGLIGSYEHAFGIDHALGALVVRPVITGVNWYTSMDTPDSSGLVSVTPGAKVRGGHEIVADEIDAEHELVWFWNSWGPGFGIGGRFAMTFQTWERLLAEQGDVTVPIL